MSGDQMVENIPNEILESIFELLTSPKDLKSLCLVNKKVNLFAKGLLWRKPNLKWEHFTIEDFKWISKMPIQILDLGEMIVWQEYPRWVARLEKSCYLHTDSLIDLFKMISEMDHLNHLKLDLSIFDCKEIPWSKLLERCKIKTITICESSLYDGDIWADLGVLDLVRYSKRHLRHFDYLESLVIEKELFGIDSEKHGFYKYFIKRQKPSPEAFKFKNLSIKILKIQPAEYVGLFQILDYFCGLKMLSLHLRTGVFYDNDCEYDEEQFLNAKSDFMIRHPKCQVLVEIDNGPHHSQDDCVLS